MPFFGLYGVANIKGSREIEDRLAAKGVIRGSLRMSELVFKKMRRRKTRRRRTAAT